MSTICDKCLNPTAATQLVILAVEDWRFDLCDKHQLELTTWLQTKDRPDKRKDKMN